MLNKGDVIQFTENHQWCGALGIVSDVTKKKNDIRYLVCIPVPEKGNVYVFSLKSRKEIERIGVAILIPKDEGNNV